MEQVKFAQEDPVWRENVGVWVANAGILDESVEQVIAAAFSAVPRRLFAEGISPEAANEDTDLPFAFDQWMTRPSTLIRMAGLINLRRKMRVIELGFGSGYLCAVMAYAGAHVFGVEQIGLLAQASRKRLDALGHHGVVVRRGEGKKGWLESAPFDGMIVSYPVHGPEELPLSQLSAGGLCVAPMIGSDGTRLTVWRRGAKRVVFEQVDFK
jgi:protein-L-isoaspartate(D-aspartate) O-methyltransferase